MSRSTRAYQLGSNPVSASASRFGPSPRRVVLVLHTGPCPRVSFANRAAFSAVLAWELRWSGPACELYLNNPGPENELVTEVEYPVA